jgi:hypothetical protein
MVIACASLPPVQHERAKELDRGCLGNTGVTGKGGPGVFLTVDKSSVNSNGFGITSDGINVNIQVANTVVVANSTGLALLNSGKIVSFSSNVFSGNLAVNGAPSSTLPAQ